ncbi:unnamed protein product [Brassica oleracea var. botrytis]
MQPSCAQVSAKSILTRALTPERAFVNSCYAWPRSDHEKNKGKC